MASAPNNIDIASLTSLPSPQSTLNASGARRIAVIATAVLWWLGGQRFGFFALSWVALTPLLWALRDLDDRARWKLGWKAGWICFALHNWWIVPTVGHGAPAIGAPPIVGLLLGAIAVSLIALIHGLQVAILAALWRPDSAFYRTKLWLLPIVVALVWGALDALRSETSMAHIWGALAFSQWRDLPLLQSVSVWGQHGLSAFLVWCAANFALWRGATSSKYFAVAPVLALVFLHVWGAWRMAQTPPSSRQLRVLLVQTNVPSLRKSGAAGESPFNQALRLTTEALGVSRASRAPIPESAAGSQSISSTRIRSRSQSTLRPSSVGAGAIDVVVWPETTAEFVRSSASNIGRADVAATENFSGFDFSVLSELSRQSGAAFVVGANTNQVVNSKTIKANEAVLIAPDGTARGSGKQRTVPFGERALFGDWLPFLKKLAPDPPIEPSQTIAPMSLPTRDGPILTGSVICFESCFVRPAKTLGEAGIKVLWIITNDQWFVGTNSPWEHAMMGVLRAVENDVPVVQVANGGHSFVVDRRGRFVVKPAILSPDVTQVPLEFGQARAVEIAVPLP